MILTVSFARLGSGICFCNGCLHPNLATGIARLRGARIERGGYHSALRPMLIGRNLIGGRREMGFKMNPSEATGQTLVFILSALHSLPIQPFVSSKLCHTVSDLEAAAYEPPLKVPTAGSLTRLVTGLIGATGS